MNPTSNSHNDPNFNFEIEISRTNQDFELEVSQANPDFEMEIQEDTSATPIPDNDHPDGNTMKCLENALMKEFCGVVHPERLTENERQFHLDKIMPCVTNFEGKFHRVDPDNEGSSVILETYTLPSAENEKYIKVKINWEMEVTIDDKPQTIRLEQYIKTKVRCPNEKNDYSDFLEINTSKNKAILSVNCHYQLHKEAILSKNPHKGWDIKRTRGRTDKLIDNLRATNQLKMVHQSSGKQYKDLDLAALAFSRMIAGETPFDLEVNSVNRVASYTSIEFESKNGSKENMEITYDGDKRVEKWVVTKVKQGDRIPGIEEVYDKDKTFFRKFQKGEKLGHNQQKIDYQGHIYALSQESIIQDPLFERYNDLSKTTRENIRDEMIEDSKKEKGRAKQLGVPPEIIEPDVLQKMVKKEFKDAKIEYKNHLSNLNHYLANFVGFRTLGFRENTKLTRTLQNDDKAKDLAKKLEAELLDILDKHKTATADEKEIVKHKINQFEKIRLALTELDKARDMVEKKSNHFTQLMPDPDELSDKNIEHMNTGDYPIYDNKTGIISPDYIRESAGRFERTVKLANEQYERFNPITEFMNNLDKDVNQQIKDIINS